MMTFSRNQSLGLWFSFFLALFIALLLFLLRETRNSNSIYFFDVFPVLIREDLIFVITMLGSFANPSRKQTRSRRTWVVVVILEFLQSECQTLRWQEPASKKDSALHNLNAQVMSFLVAFTPFG
jgi:hypothetical protein